MEDIYLSKSLKEYYSKDFTSNVLKVTDKFWKISDSIRQHLIELNECSKIQPLYSKFPDNPNSASRDESYLRIAYAKKKKKLNYLYSGIHYLIF